MPPRIVLPMAFGRLCRAALWWALCGPLTAFGQAVVPAAPPPEIIWAVNDWPPVFVLRNGAMPASAADLGEGHADRVMAELIKRLPGFTHRFQPTTPRRLWKAMSEGQPVCYAAAFKTPERLAWAYFSSVALAPPLSLVIRADLASKVSPAGGPVSLAELMRRTDLVGRTEASRSYGQRIDEMLDQAPARMREPVPHTGHSVRMVAAGRYDYTLDFPGTVEFYRRQGGLKHELAVLPLLEASDWNIGQVACTRSPWGQGVITAIDAAVREAAATRAYREAVNRWLPAPLRAQQQARFEAFFDERMRRSEVAGEVAQ